jgi:hypothetical protein
VELLICLNSKGRLLPLPETADNMGKRISLLLHRTAMLVKATVANIIVFTVVTYDRSDNFYSNAQINPRFQQFLFFSFSGKCLAERFKRMTNGFYFFFLISVLKGVVVVGSLQQSMRRHNIYHLRH